MDFQEVIMRLQPSRIGHGVRSVNDPLLIDHLRRHQIHLEVCPACNVQINLYDDYRDHPIDRLYRMGVSLSVNTDARATTPTTLSADYRQLAAAFDWGLPEFLATNIEALRASFASLLLKRRLAQRLLEGYKWSP